MQRGSAVRMSCGNIKYKNPHCRAVINAVGPDYRQLKDKQVTKEELDRELKSCFDNVLLTCEMDQLKSVAIPFISGRKNIILTFICSS